MNLSIVPDCGLFYHAVHSGVIKSVKLAFLVVNLQAHRNSHWRIHETHFGFGKPTSLLQVESEVQIEGAKRQWICPKRVPPRFDKFLFVIYLELVYNVYGTYNNIVVNNLREWPQ